MKKPLQDNDWIRTLNHKGVHTEYANDPDGRISQRRKISLLPFSVSVRRIPTGNYLKRHPEAKERSILERLSIEFFVETDEETLVAKYAEGEPLLFGKTEAPAEMAEAASAVSKAGGEAFTDEFTGDVVQKAKIVFMVMESRLRKGGSCLAEMTMQFGIDNEDKSLVLAGIQDKKSWETIPSKELNTRPKKSLANLVNQSDPNVGEQGVPRNSRWAQARGNRL